jgi:hypothetical protein
MDLFVVPTIWFRLFYGLQLMGYGRRRMRPDDQHDLAGEIGIDSDHGFLTNGFCVDEGGISAII